MPIKIPNNLPAVNIVARYSAFEICDSKSDAYKNRDRNPAFKIVE